MPEPMNRRGDRFEADGGPYSIDIVLLHDDTDLDGTFECLDADTGERIRLNGWLWSFEPLPVPFGWSIAETEVAA